MARYILLFFFIFFNSGCKNIFESTADTTSPEALTFQMQRHIDMSEWAEAIEVYQSMSPSVQASRLPRQLLASAFLGRCGFEFVSFVNDISDGLDGTNFFPLLLTAMPDSTLASAADCTFSEEQIDAIVNDLGATTVEYNFLVLNGLAKIGAFFNHYAADVTNQPAAGFDTCNVGSLPDSAVSEIVSGFSRVISHLGDSSLSFLGSTFEGACEVGEPLELAGLCDATDADSVTAAQLCAMRAVLREDQDGLGLGQAMCGNIVTCMCGGCPFP